MKPEPTRELGGHSVARATLDAAFVDSIPRSKKGEHLAASQAWITESIWPWLATAAAAQSIGISLWQHIVAVRFCLDPQESAETINASLPSITVLKPLNGCDGETGANLTSWLTQDYRGPVQVLFGVASSDDPACPAVEKLIAKYSNCNARLVICPPNGASNPKVSTLLRLMPLADNAIIVVADADVRAQNHLLRRLVTTLESPGVGLTHCLFRLANPKGLGMQVEALGVNADFWAQVLQAHSLGMKDFALGQVMALRRELLEEIGGFGRIADFLADDYQLGNLVSRNGRRVELCGVVVDCFGAPASWNKIWTHQLRWARTFRVCKPLPFFLSITGNATLWPVVWTTLQRLNPLAWSSLTLWLIVRSFLAHQRFRQLAGNSSEASHAWLAPVYDVFQAVQWAAAHLGNRVQWQGKTYRLLSDGRMVRVDPQQSGEGLPSTP
jgi:ceramide glucosyltransferase